MTRIVIKIREQVVQECEKLFIWEGKGASVEKAAEGYLELRKVVVNSLKGIFNRQEVISLIGRQNGMMITRQYQVSKEIYLYGLEDAEKYESAFTKHGSSLDVVKEKISALNDIQVFFIQELIDSFWNGQELDIDMFIDKYFC